MSNLFHRLAARFSRIRRDAHRTNVRRTFRRAAIESLETRDLLAGVELVKDIRAGEASASPHYLAEVNGTLYFSANDGVNGERLWQSNGTAAGTGLVTDTGGSNVAFPTNLANVNGTLYFSAYDAVNGSELWKSVGISDGSPASTVRVKDIRSGSSGSYPTSLTNVNGTLYFTANDGINGTELWKSDGTAAGTVMVKDVFTGSYGADPRYLTNVNGTLYFRANDGFGFTASGLWKTDGTAAGTVKVKGLRIGGGALYANAMTNVNGTLYFRGNDGPNGYELWKSDGTTLGTVLVRDINSGPEGSYPQNMTNVNGTLFFRANNRVNGQELWQSDGTLAGTIMVKDIAAGSSSARPDNLTNVNGTLFFNANDGVNGYELWKTDGTSPGTVMVKNIASGSTSAYPGFLTNVNGTLFFRAVDGPNGEELWNSDGTADGTRLVADISPGTGNSNPRNLTVMGTQLYFTASSPEFGNELYRFSEIAPPNIIIVQSGGSTSVVENGVAANKTDTFTVVLNTQPTSNVVLSVTSGDLTEATVSPATLTFTSANWSIPQTVTVSGVFDNIADGNQNAPITVFVVDAASDDSYDPVADAIVSVTVSDTPNSPPITSVTNQNTATPTFNFTDVSGETNYSLVIIDITLSPAVEAFRTGAIAANSTSYTVPGSANLLANRTYRAFLYATTPTSFSLPSGTTGPQFLFTQFTVGTPLVAPPVKPVANSISGIANQPTISWPAAVNPPADSYSVYLINLSTGLLVQSTSGIATNSFTPTSVLADGRYRIFVGAQNSFGSSGFGAPFDFTVGAPIPIPTKTVANSVNSAANPPTISWPASPSAATYSVYLISLETGALIQSKTGIASTSFTPINPLANGRYRIYVNATNVVGSSGFGAPFDFTIGAPIVIPTVPTGLNVSGTNTLTPTMSWTAVPGAATYLVWFVDRTTNTLVNSMRVTTNSYTNPIALMNGGKYRLFVLATNSAGSSVFSAPLDFTVSL